MPHSTRGSSQSAPTVGTISLLVVGSRRTVSRIRNSQAVGIGRSQGESALRTYVGLSIFQQALLQPQVFSSAVFGPGSPGSHLRDDHARSRRTLGLGF